MDIDMAVLRSLEREREIPLDTIINAIEQALLSAYQRLDGHHRNARAELDRKSGHVTIWAREEGVDGAQPGPEFDDTPEGFGRVAAATARQVIVQRMRDLEDEAILGDLTGNVLIATGADFADALSAGQLGDPLLLTHRGHLTQATRAALDEAETATIIGGRQAVSSRTEHQLQDVLAR